MSIVLAFGLLLGAATGPTNDTFAARVRSGKQAEAAATGTAYQKQLWARLGDAATVALTGCIARNAPADKSPFTVVADVPADGTPRRIDVRPATPVARCFAGWLGTMTLPTPPWHAGASGYPIEIDVSIVP